MKPNYLELDSASVGAKIILFRTIFSIADNTWVKFEIDTN